MATWFRSASAGCSDPVSADVACASRNLAARTGSAARHFPWSSPLRCRSAGRSRSGCRCSASCADKECACLARGVPARTVVSATPAVPAFLPVEQAVAIQQAEDDPPACDAHHLRERLFLLADEAQRSDGNTVVEVSVGKRRAAGIADQVLAHRPRPRTARSGSSSELESMPVILKPSLARRRVK